MTVVEQLEQAAGQVEALNGRVEELEAGIVDAASKYDAVVVERDEAKAAISVLEQERSASVDVISAKQAELDSERERHNETKEELSAAKKALENPAFADAAIVGSDQAVSGNGEGGAVVMTYDQAIAAYKKIEDPKERAAFRRDHKEELGL